MENCISVEKFVQNLRTTENNQMPISPVNEAGTHRDDKFYLTTDSPTAMIPDGERDTSSYYSPIIMVHSRQEPRHLAKGYICARSERLPLTSPQARNVVTITIPSSYLISPMGRGEKGTRFYFLYPLGGGETFIPLHAPGKNVRGDGDERVCFFNGG